MIDRKLRVATPAARSFLRYMRWAGCSKFRNSKVGREATVPLKGRGQNPEKSLRGFCQTISGEACALDKRTKREKERPERATSSEPRATPWVSMHKCLRPVRAKVWANGWLLLFPLQGVGNGNMVPRALPWALDLLGFQPAQGRRQGFCCIIFTNLIFRF